MSWGETVFGYMCKFSCKENVYMVSCDYRIASMFSTIVILRWCFQDSAFGTTKYIIRLLFVVKMQYCLNFLLGFQ